jgi:hypothetical protein
MPELSQHSIDRTASWHANVDDHVARSASGSYANDKYVIQHGVTELTRQRKAQGPLHLPA